MATKPSTPTRRYSASSCHELGFAWHIEAPASLSCAEVERLHEALVHWSDDPTQSDLDNLLADQEVCVEYHVINIVDLHRGRSFPRGSSRAVLTMTADAGVPTPISQAISFTDFPLRDGGPSRV